MRIIKYYCDKCKREVQYGEDGAGLRKIKVEFEGYPYGTGLFPKNIEVCHDCFTEITGVPVRDNGYLNGDEMPIKEANKTVGERLVGIIREVCKEEMGE
jgi:hypothetical protein